MNVEIKKTVKAGNSSAVILPRAWLNKEVRVELVKKTPETILQDVINITKNHINPGEILGVYLTGSYARNEETTESDIDVLIVSQNKDKEMIHDGIYNILIVSEELLNWKLENDLLPLGPMIKEAKPLINSAYLNSLRAKVRVTKKNVKWYIGTTEEKLEITEKILRNMDKKDLVDNRVIYTMVLRIRTIRLIQNLIKDKIYSKKEFLKLIAEISGSSIPYETYVNVKNNLEEPNTTTKEEAIKLYDYLKKQLINIRKLV